MKNFVGILLICLAGIFTSAQAEEGRIGVGYQGMFPASGLHARYGLSDELDVQGVLGFFGAFTTFAARGLYKVDKYEYPFYAFGTVGLFSENYGKHSDTGFGFGGGVGYEINWQKFIDASISSDSMS